MLVGREASKILVLLALKIFIKIVEHRRGARQPAVVVFMSHRDAGDQSVNADGFFAREFCIFKIDVMDDLRD